MNFFRYTTFLEDENRHLKDRVEKLEARNQELVLTLTSAPYREAPKEASKAKSHSISILESDAKCTCGWVIHEDDPAELQQAISAHYRQSSVPSGRKSWPQVKNALETAAATEAQRRAI